MSEKIIPEHIDPFRFAEQGLCVNGMLDIAALSRLSAMVAPSNDVVTIELAFGIDEQGVTFLKGHLNTMLVLSCQRCLQLFPYEITADFLLGVVKTLEEANSLPALYEPALAKENDLALRELVEDEIILNLPIIPRHEPEDCQVKLPFTDAKPEQGKGENPFQVLGLLKHKQKESGES